MSFRTALGVSLALVAMAGAARAQDDTHTRFRATMDQVFVHTSWRITGGYHTPAREDQLLAEGALTVPVGAVSRHTVGAPGSPGAYDVVVAGLTPWQAAARLRSAGAPFRTIFAEGAYGSQGAHLHVDPYSGPFKGKGGPPPGLPWIVAAPTPEQQIVIGLHAEADAGSPDAQLELGRVYAEGKLAPKNLVEAYVWTAFAAANPEAEPAARAKAEDGLATLAKAMSPDELADARQFVPDPAQAAAAPPRYGPVIARPRAADAVRIAQQSGGAPLKVIGAGQR